MSQWAAVAASVTWGQSSALTWPSTLSTYSASPFLCSPRWSHSHRHRRRALSVPFRRTLDRWGSRTRGSVRCNRHSIGRSGSRGAWSLLSSSCTGLRIASQLVLGLRADQHISLLWLQRLLWPAHLCWCHQEAGMLIPPSFVVRHWICHDIKYDWHSYCETWQPKLMGRT